MKKAKRDAVKNINARPSHIAQKKRKFAKPTKSSEGLAARILAIELINTVLHCRTSLDEALALTYGRETDANTKMVDARDRGFARLLATTVLRRHGQLSAIISNYLEKPLPKSGQQAQVILLLGVAQLLYLRVASHAVINTAVELSRQRRASARFAGLINALLRRVAENSQTVLSGLSSDHLNIPDWMLKRWITTYGEETACAIASASINEPALDITVCSNPEDWASKLNGQMLPTGTIRRRTDGRIEELTGFEDGQWWVQDAAAAIPVRLLGDIAGRRVADLCAAPGGKTAQLVSAGGLVTALDISQARLVRVRENLTRLGLVAQLVVGDAATWRSDYQFDAILLDVPCSATGTIRRHPDILHLKRPSDIIKLNRLQSAILSNAALNLLKPGGTLIYCTCSLEPEEGEAQIETFLACHTEFQRMPIKAKEVGGIDEFITAYGDVQTMPHHLRLEDPALSGIDGFFISRLIRKCIG